MNKVSQHLRCDGEEIAGRKEPLEGISSRGVLGMLQHLRRHEKSRVNSMNHERPSSISPNKSSSAVGGRKTPPRLTGGMSSKLCGCGPAAGEGAKTVTTSPSGRRTLSS